MGLDMYAYKTQFQPKSEIDFKVPEDVDNIDFFYWRKHPNLHGWMESLYNKKGGQQEFNMVNLQLTLDDLESLRKDVNANRLPLTSGFFFGSSDGSLEEIQETLTFITEAEEAIQEGYTVYYSSWW